jgi:hypothetical protein
MNDRKSRYSTPRQTGSGSMIQRFLRRWRLSTEEQYLSEATDHADLERRMRAVERASGGPVFVTFNH